MINKKYVLWNVYLHNAVALHTSLSKYLTVIVMTLNYDSSRSPKVMVPIESPSAVSYLTSFDSNIVSLTIFEILDLSLIHI